MRSMLCRTRWEENPPEPGPLGLVPDKRLEQVADRLGAKDESAVHRGAVICFSASSHGTAASGATRSASRRRSSSSCWAGVSSEQDCGSSMCSKRSSINRTRSSRLKASACSRTLSRLIPISYEPGPAQSIVGRVPSLSATGGGAPSTSSALETRLVQSGDRRRTRRSSLGKPVQIMIVVRLS
jgi:hypothetical protein